MSIISYDLTHPQTPAPSRTEPEIMAIYDKWLVTHKKTYNGIREKDRRFNIFRDNLRFIDEHNSVLNRTYKVGLNVFADLTNDEYRSSFLGLRMDDHRPPLNPTIINDTYTFRVGDELPDSVDWRDKGAVFPIRNQGKCGSCWAFSTIAAVEGINKIRTGKLIALSEQELVDCDTSNHGCRGGFPISAYKFIYYNDGVDSREDYPYKGVNATCDQERLNRRVAKIGGYGVLYPKDELTLQKAVAGQPVVVAIEARGKALQLYKSGVFTGECGTSIDHAVVVIGYGTQDGVDYWLVRNSWSTYWGEGSYIKIQRNVLAAQGKCGIVMDASFPTLWP